MRHYPKDKPASDGNQADLRADRLGSTVDYHNSLLDEARQQRKSARLPRPYPPQACHQTLHPLLGSLRQWLPLSNSTRRAGAGAIVNKDNNLSGRGKNVKNENHQTNRERAPPPPPPPPPPHAHLSQEEIKEFEALPIAIRRKYFSTLERLRLAQGSGVSGLSGTLPSPPKAANDDAYRHHKRRGASLSVGATGKPPDRPTTAPPCRHHSVSVDSAFLAKLPAKIREKHLTREEQVIVARQLRRSVILDAADEAFFKAGRRVSRRPSPPPLYSPTLPSSTRPGMERPLVSDDASTGAHDAFYDSFRWLDDDDDLDLRLALDDYHVNMKESVPMPPEAPRPPSFRRHVSFSKIPFSRTSVSSSRPVTKDAVSPTANPSFARTVAHPQSGRRKSRALSLIAPKQSAQESLSSIDLGAAHYQDPEARLKLRVYLASPQKFDEAIEFGFPSNDGDLPSTKSYSREMLSVDSELFKTFLSDDRSSTCSEDTSLPDPESPRTPTTLDKHAKPFQFPGTDDYRSSYAQAPAASREMTLRMTLTRPDLRACEDQMYGWQKPPRHYSGKPSQAFTLRDDRPPTAACATYGPKESIDKIFAEIDQELAPPSADSNVVKRFWNRVRRV
ncbi:hypothetical protein GGR54DRAFT_85809 [Hypoxylon sp. NC1633]|nr:hypothetical protein GGR54DRAFT_85809 [Hypoxylon sp. NC1633]